MTEPFRILVQYKERRLAIIIDPRNKQEIKILLDPILSLQVAYQIYLKFLEAEVLYTTDLVAGDDLYVVSQQIEEVVPEQEERREMENEPLEKSIDLSQLKEKLFDGCNLIDELNSWSIPLKFKLRYGEGVKRYPGWNKRVGEKII